jgi:hypothetical protein
LRGKERNYPIGEQEEEEPKLKAKHCFCCRIAPRKARRFAVDVGQDNAEAEMPAAQ